MQRTNRVGYLHVAANYEEATAFSILRNHAVRFYGAGFASTASYFAYSDDEDEDDTEVNEDGDDPLLELEPGR